MLYKRGKENETEALKTKMNLNQSPGSDDIPEIYCNPSNEGESTMS